MHLINNDDKPIKFYACIAFIVLTQSFNNPPFFCCGMKAGGKYTVNWKAVCVQYMAYKLCFRKYDGCATKDISFSVAKKDR